MLAAGLEPVLVARVVHRHVERVALAAHVAHVDGQEAEAIGHVEGHEVEQLARELDVQQRDPGHRELVREDLRQLRLVDQPALDQQGPDPAPVAPLLLKHLIERLRGDQLRIDQQLSEAQAGSGHSLAG